MPLDNFQDVADEIWRLRISVVAVGLFLILSVMWLGLIVNRVAVAFEKLTKNAEEN